MQTRKHRTNALSRNRRGVSTIISTIIITGTLLIILVIASFVSANVLDMQIANTEFEQAKTNMLTLDETIQDVALRRGSGGYVQFNQRSGGIGINVTTQTLRVLGPPTGSLILRPNGPGTYQNWTTYGGSSNNWAATGDSDDTTGVTTSVTSKDETENLANTLQTGTISSVTVYVRAATNGNRGKINLLLRTHNITYTISPSPIQLNATFTVYGQVQVPNPYTNSPWNWSEINDLQIGAVATALGQSEAIQVSEFWIAVNYAVAQPDVIYESTSDKPLVSIVYRGGSKVSGTSLDLSGSSNLTVSMSDPLGYVRVATDNGLKIKLDYFRIRVTQGTTMIVGNTNYNFTEITYIRIVPGTFGGSGTVNCQVQNINVNAITRQYTSNNVTLTVQLDNGTPQTMPLYSADPSTYTAIIFTEVVIQVSIT